LCGTRRGIRDDQRQVGSREMLQLIVAHKAVTVSILEIASRDGVTEWYGRRCGIVRIEARQRERIGSASRNNRRSVNRQGKSAAAVEVDAAASGILRGGSKNIHRGVRDSDTGVKPGGIGDVREQEVRHALRSSEQGGPGRLPLR